MARIAFFKLLTALALALLVRPSVAESDNPGDVAGLPSFERADRDGSGYVERAESEALSGLDFESADRDNDGRLARTEYQAAVGRVRPGGYPPGVPRPPVRPGTPAAPVR